MFKILWTGIKFSLFVTIIAVVLAFTGAPVILGLTIITAATVLAVKLWAIGGFLFGTLIGLLGMRYASPKNSK